MNIKLNTKTTDVTVYDKVNLIHANKDEVINLTTNINKDIKSNLVDIISNSLNLTESERELYECILVYIKYNKEVTDKIDLYNITITCSKVKGKSLVTYKRAVESLIVKGVIKYGSCYRDAVIIDEYNISKVADNIKYIVIEVKPSDKDL